MKLIDFDREFTQYMMNWMEENRDSYQYADEMEKDLPGVYDTFLDTPAPWLKGMKPGEYFGQFDDARQLVSWMEAYIDGGVDVPDMLLNRIVELGSEAEEPLLAVLSLRQCPLETRMLAVTLLREIGSSLPMETYIAWQCSRDMEDEICDNAIDSLEEMGDKVVKPMLAALDKADDKGREALLSVLSRYPGNEKTYTELMRLFEHKPERRAILAAYLGRLGDERALPALMAAAKDDNTPYLDYIELRSAIEMLGGEAPEREFDEDAAYQALFGEDDE